MTDEELPAAAPEPTEKDIKQSYEEEFHLGREGRQPGSKIKLSPEAREKMSRLMKERQEKLRRLRQIAAIKTEIAKRKEELDYRKRHNAIKYYTVRRTPVPGTKEWVWEHRGPHAQQHRFHRAKTSIRVASGGNRSGKSTAGINEDVAHALGYRPWLEETDPDYKVNVRVPNKGLICGEAFGEQVKKVLIPKLLGDPENGVPGAIPTHLVAETKKNPFGIIVYIKVTNGSEIFLQSYDQDVDLFESADYDWVHFDEPPPRAIWVAVQRGLTDREAPCWLTMTPLKEPWIYDEIYNRPDCTVLYFDIEDNLNFGLTRKGIDQFSASLTDDEKEARLRGRFFHLTGLVYKNYGAIHRIKRERVFSEGVMPHWGLWMHIDCHPKKPHHAIWVAIAPDQRKYVVGAIKNGDPLNRIAPFCEAIKVYERTVLKASGENIVRLIDPLSGTPNPVAEGLTIWDEFDKYGITCKPGSKNRDAGILLLQNELKYSPEEGTYPNIFFCDDLDGVDYEMRHYIWDEHLNKKTAERQDEKQVPRKKHDDYIEGIHRILLDSPYCDFSGEDDETDDDRYEKAHATAGANRVTGY